jgi:hypothetical protein
MTHVIRLLLPRPLVVGRIILREFCELTGKFPSRRAFKATFPPEIDQDQFLADAMLAPEMESTSMAIEIERCPMSVKLSRRWITALAAGMMLFFTSSTITLGQNSKPSGTLSIHQVQVAFIGSGTSGGGTLRFGGKNYSFKLGGLGIGGIGVSRINASGTVYNLNRLQDFNGVYGQARTGWAAGKSGKGEMWLQNTNGVYLRLHAQRKGLSLSLGADGIVIQLQS